MDARPTSTPPRLPELVRIDPFRKLLRTRLVGQLADGVLQSSLAYLFFLKDATSASPDRVATAAGVLLLPYCLVGPFAGLVIDRAPRQRVLLVANVVRAALVVPLAVLLGLSPDAPTGALEVAVTAVALLTFSVNRFILAALSAALPPTVPPGEALVTADSLSGTSGTVVAALGGGLGLALGHVAGSAAAAGLACLLYLVAGWAASRLPRMLLGPAGVDRFVFAGVAHEAALVVRQTAAAVRHIASRPEARDALAAITAHRTAYGLSTVLTVVLYQNAFKGLGGVFAGGTSGLAEIVAAAALGVAVAAVLTPRAVRRLGTQRWIAGLYVVAGVTELVLGLPFSRGGFLLAAFVVSLAAQGSKICTDALVQTFVDDDFRGRAFSFYDVIFNTSTVAAAAFGALVLPASGRSVPVIVGIASVYLLTGLVYGYVTRRQVQLAALPVVAAPAPAAR